MFYYERDVLPVVSFDEPVDEVGWGVIESSLCEHPCNIVLIEVREKLYGIISHGDMIRAREKAQEAVPVNTGFTKLEGKRFMQARETFKERLNIHEIPVVDENGALMGICSRYDDLLYLEYSDPWTSNRYVEPFVRSLDLVYFVKPPIEDARRRQVMQNWVDHFTNWGVTCELIEFKELPSAVRRGKIVLVTDEEQNLAAHALFEVLRHEDYPYEILYTCKELESKMSEHAYDDIVQKLADSGISIYNLIFTTDDSTPGRKRLNAGFKEWLSKPGARSVNPYVVPSQAKEFYGDDCTAEYAELVGKHVVELDVNDNYTRLKDCTGPYFNVKHGERFTADQPENAAHTIYFFGPCMMIGTYVEDGQTIESCLQRRINEAGYNYKVVNCGCYETHYQEMVHITSTPMKPGDIVVLHIENREYAGTTAIDLMALLDKHDVPSGWLLDLPLHCNGKVNEIYAGEIFDKMVADGTLAASADDAVETAEDAGGEARDLLARGLAVNSLYLDLYFNDFHPEEGMTVGTVGMHGNPFTLGHRYLIETASKQVDKLFVLLIGDELGIFSYAERFAMAVDATADLENVTIVSGGPFQATRNVFKGYFLRIEPSAMKDSALGDTLIYAQIIAPRLGCTYRFLGDEKHNPKMSFFNELMIETLPKFGINVVELPRMAVHGKSISASTSRNAAAEGDMETLLENVPPTTLKYLVG